MFAIESEDVKQIFVRVIGTTLNVESKRNNFSDRDKETLFLRHQIAVNKALVRDDSAPRVPNSSTKRLARIGPISAANFHFINESQSNLLQCINSAFLHLTECKI